MSAGTCPREPELLDALGRGFVPPELAAHAAECPDCADLHAVASAVLDEKPRAVAEAPVPSSGTVWWRMRLRQRREAEERARRSLWIGQAATLAVALGIVLALFGAEAVTALRHLAGSLPLGNPIVLTLGILLAAGAVVTPVAGWLALRRR